ncbi:class E basic helix-loop-helix protein 41 [Bombina bombina]|uniref:class E basic helix-loop-helix protein 41 n=1 Tax=Bombina bombina TaxID=8345 RepID=UPI00235A4F89|nr:class E basic helix-loop-helix protein 41 [Bombina bombina]
MDEGIHSLQERQLLEHREFLGMDYPSLYVCKPKRGIKRDESKETYKLPHRLIEKKRRDRINECIAQLKDLLPEHLKLTTLGHLEKAVVLELTLKHLKGLTALTEQQHQKIIALQNGERSIKSPIQSDLDAFHSGFQTCAKEVLQYLSRFESWTSRDQRCTQLLNHLHTVSSQILPNPQLLLQQIPGGKGPPTSPTRGAQKVEKQTNCVPVIQRTHNLELSENDTDTDSGYGGEGEKIEGKSDGHGSNGLRSSVTVKQEPMDEPSPKRFKADCSSGSVTGAEPVVRPDAALLSSLMGFGGAPFGQQAPFCLPFYFISPSAAAAAAAAYMPFLDKGGLEKYLYPAAAAPIPLIYPGIPAQAAGTFPCLSSVLSPDKVAGCSSAMLPELASSPFQAGPLAAVDRALSEDLNEPLQDLLQPSRENCP